MLKRRSGEEEEEVAEEDIAGGTPRVATPVASSPQARGGLKAHEVPAKQTLPLKSVPETPRDPADRTRGGSGAERIGAWSARSKGVAHAEAEDDCRSLF